MVHFWLVFILRILLATFLIFNIINYFIQSTNQQRRTKKTINEIFNILFISCLFWRLWNSFMVVAGSLTYLCCVCVCFFFLDINLFSLPNIARFLSNFIVDIPNFVLITILFYFWIFRIFKTPVKRSTLFHSLRFPLVNRRTFCLSDDVRAVYFI